MSSAKWQQFCLGLSVLTLVACWNYNAQPIANLIDILFILHNTLCIKTNQDFVHTEISTEYTTLSMEIASRLTSTANGQSCLADLALRQVWSSKDWNPLLQTWINFSASMDK